MTPIRILGIVVLAVGVLLLGFAFQASESPVEQISNTLTGRYTDDTMLYLILGVAAAVGGGLTFALARRRQ